MKEEVKGYRESKKNKVVSAQSYGTFPRRRSKRLDKLTHLNVIGILKIVEKQGIYTCRSGSYFDTPFFAKEQCHHIAPQNNKWIIISEPKNENRHLQKEFNDLAKQWMNEVRGQSTMSQALTPAYLKILTLGKDVTPLILKELDKKPNFWFLALRTINDENPVPPEHMGNVLKMRDDWIAWGKKKRLI